MDKTVAQVADTMLETADAKTYFGDSLDSDQLFIEHIYLNTLNKTNEDDPDGITFWVNQLKEKTRGEVVENLISAIDSYAPNGANYNSEDITTVAAYNQFTNRVDVSNYYANTLLTAPVDYATSTSFSGDLTVTDNLSSVSTAKFSKDTSGLGTLSTSDTLGVASLNSDRYWDSSLSTITYSFNSYIPTYYTTYIDDRLTDGWQPLNTQMQDAVDLAFEDVNQYLGISLEKVSSDGLIQLNMVDMEPYTSGFSFMPGTYWEYDGDMFLNNDFTTSPDEFGLNPGEYGYLTIQHELGHALGLKHPFEDGNELSVSLDDVNHTIMSYTSNNSYIPELSFSSRKIYIDYTKIHPSSYSIYDIAALQAVYGVNTTTNIDDTIYTTSYDENKIQTIWDAGGTDTIDLSTATGSSTIDLRAGSLNSADQKTLEDVIKIYQDIATANGKSEHHSWIADNITNLYETDNLYTGINNFGIATGTIIENITTGSGADTVTDNEVDNIINTGFGDDKIYLGNGGYDTIDGSDGSDTIYLNLLQEDIALIYLDNQSYLLSGTSFGVNFVNIETIQFQDGSIVSPDMLI